MKRGTVKVDMQITGPKEDDLITRIELHNTKNADVVSRGLIPGRDKDGSLNITLPPGEHEIEVFDGQRSTSGYLNTWKGRKVEIPLGDLKKIVRKTRGD